MMPSSPRAWTGVRPRTDSGFTVRDQGAGSPALTGAWGAGGGGWAVVVASGEDSASRWPLGLDESSAVSSSGSPHCVSWVEASLLF